MRTTLTATFFLAVLVLAAASPRLSRRQAPPAPTPEAPAPAEASGPPPPPPTPADAAPPAPAAPAPVQPQARARPPPPQQQPPPQAASPAEPSVFVLPDGAGLILGGIREGFTCEGKIYGYYADTNNDCKIFHVCVPVLDNQGQATQPPLIFSFFCNNGTIFNQENLVCDYADNVDCSQSESHYSINQEFGKIPEGSPAAQGRSAPVPPPPAPVAPPPAPVPTAPVPPPPAPAAPSADVQPSAPPAPAGAAAGTRAK